jgi:hypothetical protein
MYSHLIPRGPPISDFVDTGFQNSPWFWLLSSIDHSVIFGNFVAGFSLVEGKVFLGKVVLGVESKQLNLILMGRVF